MQTFSEVVAGIGAAIVSGGAIVLTAVLNRRPRPEPGQAAADKNRTSSEAQRALTEAYEPILNFIRHELDKSQIQIAHLQRQRDADQVKIERLELRAQADQDKIGRLETQMVSFSFAVGEWADYIEAVEAYIRSQGWDISGFPQRPQGIPLPIDQLLAGPIAAYDMGRRRGPVTRKDET